MQRGRLNGRPCWGRLPLKAPPPWQEVAAVGIDDDLAAGQAIITLRAAHNKAAGGVDVVLDVLIQQLGGDDLFDDLVEDVLVQLFRKLTLGCSAGWR